MERFGHVLIQAPKKHVGKIKTGGRKKLCIMPPVCAAIKRRNRIKKDMRNNQEDWKESAKEVRKLKREALENACKEYLSEAIDEKDETKVYKISRS